MTTGGWVERVLPALEEQLDRYTSQYTSQPNNAEVFAKVMRTYMDRTS